MKIHEDMKNPRDLDLSRLLGTAKYSTAPSNKSFQTWRHTDVQKHNTTSRYMQSKLLTALFCDNHSTTTQIQPSGFVCCRPDDLQITTDWVSRSVCRFWFF